MTRQVHHNPGPWKFITRETEDGTIHHEIMARGLGQTQDADPAILIACMSPVSSKWRKNAALIESAPELLEALEAALLDLQDFHSETCEDDLTERSIIRQVRAAIAKAKGEV